MSWRILRASLFAFGFLVGFALPFLWIGTFLLALAGLFACAVALWAFVLLAERWLEEGLARFTYLDALSESLRDIVLGIRRLAHF